MAAGRPITNDERRRVAELHAQGMTRNAIATELNRSGKTVSKIAAEQGLTFERGEQVRAATEARKVDAKARRTALAVALLEDAERLRQQLWQPTVAFNFGGKDNTYADTTLPEPTFGDKRNIMQAIGVAVDRAVRLDEYDSGTGLGEVVGLLDRLGKGLAAKYGNGDDEHPIDDEAQGVASA